MMMAIKAKRMRMATDFRRKLAWDKNAVMDSKAVAARKIARPSLKVSLS